MKHPQKLGDHLSEPDAVEVSFVALYDGWAEDLLRLHASISRHTKAAWELVVVDNPVDEAASETIVALGSVNHIPLRDHVGFAAGRNIGLRQATGRIVVIVDTSVELTGDVAGPIARALEDPGVGMVGRWGVTTDHGFHFEESDGPEVDGVEAYLMAMRRGDLARTGLFHAKFKWYRNADLDFSFQVRAQGLRTIIDTSLPVVRHEHRLWESTPEGERDEQSRKNFFRFRDHWAERDDLFVAR